jgi:hypothetical protein
MAVVADGSGASGSARPATGRRPLRAVAAAQVAEAGGMPDETRFVNPLSEDGSGADTPRVPTTPTSFEEEDLEKGPLAKAQQEETRTTIKKTKNLKEKANSKAKHALEVFGLAGAASEEEIADATFNRLFKLLDRDDTRTVEPQELADGMVMVARTWKGLLDYLPPDCTCPTKEDTAGDRDHRAEAQDWRCLLKEVLPCAMALANEAEDSMVNQPHSFVSDVWNLLEEDFHVVKNQRDYAAAFVRDGMEDQTDEETPTEQPAKKQKVTSAARVKKVKDERRSLVSALTNLYLRRVVLPILESWNGIFNVLDQDVSDVLTSDELGQGLSTCCAPDIDILHNAAMVQATISSIEYISAASQLVEQILLGLHDHKLGLKRNAKRALIAHKQSSVRTEFVPKLDAGAQFMQALNGFRSAAEKVHCLAPLQQSVETLVKATQAVTSEITLGLKHGWKRQSPDGWEKVIEGGWDKEETQAEEGETQKRSKQEKVRKFLTDAEATKDVCSRLVELCKQHSGTDRRYDLHAVIRIQAAWRGRVTRSLAMLPVSSGPRSPRSLRSDDNDDGQTAGNESPRSTAAATRGKEFDDAVIEHFIKSEAKINYFDWPIVLLRWMDLMHEIDKDEDAPGQHPVQDLRKWANEIYKIYNEKYMSLEERSLLEQSLLEGNEGERDKLASTEFPGNLLLRESFKDTFTELGVDPPRVGRKVEERLDSLRVTLHSWTAVLTLMDQDTSQYLTPLEVTVAMMAFAHMGVLW